jgi:uncharacterized membrane protein
MKKLKMGTPLAGIIFGAALVAIAVLIMLIGFWKVLLLVALFAIGYFIGTVENKQEFLRDTANKIIPAKEAKMIDIKSEITREQEEKQEESAVPEEEPAEAEEETEDGE